MGETYWPDNHQPLTLNLHERYAQTFTPLWTHTLDKIRLIMPYYNMVHEVKLAIQYLKPDGTPTGIDLTARTFYREGKPYGKYTNTLDTKFTPIRIVAGISYALLVYSTRASPFPRPTVRYKPPPSGYPRGKLIKSTDDGATWDTTDLGDLLFSEYGDPPLNINPFLSPVANVTITTITIHHYWRNACIRVGTTSPATLRLHITNLKPTPYETLQLTRGTRVMCLEHHRFVAQAAYDQLEHNDSLYHTFYIGGLKNGQLYWYTFTTTTDFVPSLSRSPIFSQIHPTAPSFTTTLRPSAPGDTCWIPHENGSPCPNHYLNVNESSPDEDASCVYTSSILTGWWTTDLYAIPNLPAATTPIGKVSITIRCRRQGGMAYVHVCRHVIKTHGTIYMSDPINQVPTTYKNYHWNLSTNPHTGTYWDRAEIDALQIGVALKHYRGVGWASAGWCTQVYAKIAGKCDPYQ